MTSASMLMSAVILAPLIAWDRNHRALFYHSVGRIWRGIACIGVMNASQIALNNASLVRITISLNQLIRAASPIIVALCAKYLENQSPSRRQFIALVTLTFGVMMSVHQGAEGEPLGLVLVASSTLVMSFQMSFSGRIMHGEKVNPLFLVVCTGPIAFVSLAPFAWVIEGEAFVAYIGDKGYSDACMMIATNSILAATYTVVVLSLIKEISSVGVCLVGNCQLILLLVLADVVLGETEGLSPKKIIGVVLTIGGALAYTVGRLEIEGAAPKSMAAEALPPIPHAVLPYGVSWWRCQAVARRLYRVASFAKFSDDDLAGEEEARATTDVEEGQIVGNGLLSTTRDLESTSI